MPEEKKSIAGKSSTKQTKESIQEKSTEWKEKGKEKFEQTKDKFISSVSTEAKEIEERISHLPVNRKIIFFTGILLFVCGFLGLIGGVIGIFGNIISILVALGMVYASITEKNAITKMMEQKKDEGKK